MLPHLSIGSAALLTAAIGYASIMSVITMEGHTSLFGYVALTALFIISVVFTLISYTAFWTAVQINNKTYKDQSND